ncbi:MAG: hypothetical protein MJ001_02390, partial [Paludibacteraceae bacterium]|nr:hypothetical protein [Paludibacteraceae bacterium]
MKIINNYDIEGRERGNVFMTDSVNAVICSGDYYDFHGEHISATGLYYDTTEVDGGSYVIHILHLTVKPIPVTTISQDICHGSSYPFKGENISVAGVYSDTLKTGDGCDSIVKLVLNVAQNYLFESRATICQGEIYNFRGQNVTAAGIYYDRLGTIYGCDSIYKLTLTVNPSYELQDSVTVECGQGNSYVRNGKTYTESTIFKENYRTVEGCDSNVTVILNIKKTYHYTDYVEICQGDSFKFRGDYIRHTCIYTDSMISHDGCDSIIDYVFNVKPSFHFYDTAYICKGASYNYHGKILYDSGIYYDSLETESGCDSIYQLLLVQNDRFYELTHDTICSDEEYNFNGVICRNSGIYFDSHKTINGCDSIYELRLTVLPRKETTIYEKLCKGATKVIHNNIISEPGIYYDTLLSVDGCDSVIKIIVNHAESYHFESTITLCQGSTYEFRGRTISSPGLYYDSLLTKDGCDSIYILNVKGKSSTYQIVYDTVCGDKAYYFHGMSYRKTGVYTDTLVNGEGCDSICELHLEVYPTYEHTINLNVCQGNVVRYRDKEYSKTGIYYDSLLTKNGCDSILKIIVHSDNTYFYQDTAYICHGSLYFFRGRTLASPGIYYDSLKTMNGCDSVYQLLLVEYPTYHFITIDTVYCGTSYSYRGKTYTESGIYYENYKTVNGCDSIYELDLTLYKKHEFTDYVSLCHGSSLQYRNQTISQSGVYWDSLKTTGYGCDSVYKIVVNWADMYEFNDTASICQGSVYQWHGRNLTLPGIYYDSLKSVASGCDSIFKLRLIVKSSFDSVKYDTAFCQSNYEYRGKVYTQSGTYREQHLTSEGCDSTYTLHLVITHPSTSVEHFNICEGESFTYRGELHFDENVLRNDTSFNDTLTAANGCDSIVTVIINVHPVFRHSETRHICLGETYNFRGMTIWQAGEYYDRVPNGAGCDDVYQLTLVVDSAYHRILYDTVCTNESHYNTYSSRGMSSSGVYFDTLRTVSGCDSIIELRLTVYQATETVVDTTLCPNSVMYIRGMLIDKTGVYYDRLSSKNGYGDHQCDSVIKYVVNISDGYLTVDTAYLCKGSSYMWRSRHLTQKGIYYDSLSTSTAGCDSVFKLVLYEREVFDSVKYDTVYCQPSYTYRGKTYTKSGTYYERYVSSLNGCDSTYTLHLEITHPSSDTIRFDICEGENFTYRGRLYFDGNTQYRDTTFNDTILAANGCDSIITVMVSVHPVFNQSVTRHICSGETYNFRGRTVWQPGIYYDRVPNGAGCDDVYELILEVDSAYHRILYDTVCTNESQYNTYSSRGRSSSGIYFDTLRTVSGCDSIIELRLTVYQATETVVDTTLCPNSVMYIRGMLIDKAGVYYDRLSSKYGHGGHQCDSVIKYVVNMADNYLTVDTASICGGSYYRWRNRDLSQPGLYYDSLRSEITGCDSVYKLVLSLKPTFDSVKYDTVYCRPYYEYRGVKYTESGTYHERYVSATGCDSTYTLHLEITHPSSD